MPIVLAFLVALQLATQEAFRIAKNRNRKKLNLPTAPVAHDAEREELGRESGAALLESSNDRLSAKLQPVNQQQRNFPGEHGQVTTGLALSGGGTRAMSCSMGALRALENLGLMSKIDALSSGSGGTWAAAIYMFQKKYSLDELLGSPTDPQSLTFEELSTGGGRMPEVINEPANVRIAFYVAWYSNREVWERLMSDLFLEPFDIGSRGAMLASNDSHVDDIIRRNPQLQRESFLTPQAGRPKVFVSSGIMVGPVGWRSTLVEAIPFQMSPDFTGFPFWPKYDTSTGQPLAVNYSGLLWGSFPLIGGGGFIESFAFGGTSPSSQSVAGDITVARPTETLSLATIMGISSTAVNLMYQDRPAWPILPEGQTQEAQDMVFADGGITENTAMVALLQRKVKKAVLVSSTGIGTDSSVDYCDSSRSVAEWVSLFATCVVTPCTLTALFGYAFSSNINDYTRNHVFPTDRFLPMMCRIQTLVASGKPAVLVEELPVLENQWYGIEGGSTLELLLVMLDKVTDFEQMLPQGMQDNLTSSTSQFADHPKYSLFEHSDPMYLKTSMVNLLAAQCEYSITSNEALFREFLG